MGHFGDNITFATVRYSPPEKCWKGNTVPEFRPRTCLRDDRSLCDDTLLSNVEVEPNDGEQQ
jgi:hypothetical protein